MKVPVFYLQCRENYNKSHTAAANHLVSESDSSLYAFTAWAGRPGQALAPDDPIMFPADWSSRIKLLAVAAASALDDDAQIYRPNGLNADHDPARRLRSPIGLPGLETIIETIVNQVEQSLYGCHVAVDKVHIFRQMPSRTKPFSGGSWVWHADGHPAEFIKAQVYLSDVDESTSMFQLLWSENRNRALRAVSSPMNNANWADGEARIGAEFDEEFIATWRDRGYQERSITGPAGTTVLFNTNCVHRGTIAHTKPRDSLILRLRPVLQRQVPRLRGKAVVGEYTFSQPFAS